MRQEIQRVFGVKLSQETLRPLFAELKRQPSSPSAQGATGFGAGQTTAEGLPQSDPKVPDNQGVSAEVWEKVCDCAAVEVPPQSAKPELAVVPQTLWCDRLGLLLFAPILVAVEQVIEPAEALLKRRPGAKVPGLRHF